MKKKLPKAIPPVWHRHIQAAKKRLRKKRDAQILSPKQCRLGSSPWIDGTGRSKMQEFLDSCKTIEQAKEKEVNK